MLTAYTASNFHVRIHLRIQADCLLHTALAPSADVPPALQELATIRHTAKFSCLSNCLGDIDLWCITRTNCDPTTSTWLQINRLASWAVMLHCLLPPGWVPPLHPPSIQPSLGGLCPPCSCGGSALPTCLITKLSRSICTGNAFCGVTAPALSCKPFGVDVLCH